MPDTACCKTGNAHTHTPHTHLPHTHTPYTHHTQTHTHTPYTHTTHTHTPHTHARTTHIHKPHTACTHHTARTHTTTSHHTHTHAPHTNTHTTLICNNAILYRTSLLVTEIRCPLLFISIPPFLSSSSSFPLSLSYLLVPFPSSSPCFPLSSAVHLTCASRLEPSSCLRLAVCTCACHTFSHNWPRVSHFGCSQ